MKVNKDISQESIQLHNLPDNIVHTWIYDDDGAFDKKVSYAH